MLAAGVVRHARATASPCSETPQESEVEGCEHQDNSQVRRQPLPEAVFEEQQIDRDDHGHHQDHVQCSRKRVAPISRRTIVAIAAHERGL